MNNLRLTLVALFFVVSNSFSQTFQISGKVVNTSNEIIPFANILLLNSTDSTFVKGTSANENGLFEFKDDRNHNSFLFHSHTLVLVFQTDIGVKHDRTKLASKSPIFSHLFNVFMQKKTILSNTLFSETLDVAC